MSVRIVVFLLLLAAAFPVRADSLPPGVTLPAGAVTRLGSPDWRLLGQLNSIVLSPDGRTLAATNEGTLELLDSTTGKRRFVLATSLYSAGAAPRMPVAFSPDGRKIAVCVAQKRDWQSRISIRDGSGQRQEQSISFIKKDRADPVLPREAHIATTRYIETKEYVSALAFSRDGTILAAAVRFHFKCCGTDRVFLETEENVVHLWDVTTGKHILELPAHKKEIKFIFFSVGAWLLTAVAEDGLVRSWSTSSGRETHRRQADGAVFCAACSPDGQLLALGSRKTVLLHETTTAKVRRLAVAAGEVRAVAFSRDGRLLVAAGEKSLRLWRADTGTVLKDAPAFAHPVVTLAFSADGRLLFSGHKDEQVIRCWSAATLAPAVPLEGHAADVGILTFTSDGKRVLSATLEDGDFRLWDARSGKQKRGPEDQKLLQTWWLASLGRTWPVLCEPLFFGYQTTADLDLFPIRRLPRLKSLPGFFLCSSDGKRILTIKKERGKRVLIVSDSSDDKVIRQFPWKDGDDVSAALSADGRTVAAAAGEVVCFLDVDSGKQRRFDFSTRKSAAILHTACVKFSPDDSRIVVVGNQGTLRIVSVQDGRVLAEIAQGITEPGVQGISSAAFSPDGKTLTTGGPFGSFLVYEVLTGQLIRRHRGAAFLFSPDNRLAAIRQRNSLRLHDLFSGESVREYMAPQGLLERFTFSPDGRRLAVACPDTTILILETAASKSAKPLPEKNLEQLWNDLGQDEAPLAYRAMGRLLASPARSLALLGKHLQQPPRADPERLQRLIADLDHEEFGKREAAMRALSRLDSAAGRAMRAALGKKPSAEMQRRLQRLLRELEQKQISRQRSSLRAIQVLEAVGTTAAQRLLKRLAADSPDAQAALGRLQPKR